MRIISAAKFKKITGEPYIQSDVERICALENLNITILPVIRYGRIQVTVHLATQIKNFSIHNNDLKNVCVISLRNIINKKRVLHVINNKNFPEIYKRYSKIKAFL